MAVDVAQIGQVEVASIGQEQSAPQALGLGAVVVFGIGIRTQRNGDGDLLKQLQGAVELDGGRTHRVETAREDVRQGCMEGQGAAILNDDPVEFTEGLTGFKTQHFHAEFAHDVTKRGTKELGTLVFDQLIVEASIMGIEVPQFIELAVQPGNAFDLLGGHGGDHRKSESKRGNEPFAFGKSKPFASVIEHSGVQNGLELVGHGGKLLGIHPTCLYGFWVKGLGCRMDLA